MKPLNDPLWNEYAESVAGLAELPALLTARKAEAAAGQETALTNARAARDAELRRCRDWRAQAKRATANAEAKLVAAKVLIPDASQAPQLPVGKPQHLVDELSQAVRRFDEELSGLDAATRRSRDAELLQQRRDAEIESRRHQMRIVAYILAGAILVLIALVLVW